MKRLLSFLIVLSSLIFLPAAQAVIPDPVPCFKELQVNFFQESTVYQALGLYGIPQGLWSPIAQTLKTKSYRVPERMKKVTARMVPNPIEYPMQREATAALLKEVLKNVFFEVLTQYQVNERPRADFLFDYIFTKQLPMFINCFGEEVRSLAPSFD